MGAPSIDYEEFFDQLKSFSTRYIRNHHGAVRPVLSPWRGRVRDKTTGVIIHYTKNDDAMSTLRWFLREKYGAKSSAHFLVLPYSDHTEKETAGLPLMDLLPTTILMIVPLKETAWHATWCNKTTIGIENVNGGHTRNGYGELLFKPYSEGQIQSNKILIKALSKVFPAITPGGVLGHEQVQGVDTKGSSRKDKRDPGPLFPLREVRSEVFGKVDRRLPLDLLGEATALRDDTRKPLKVVKAQILSMLQDDPINVHWGLVLDALGYCYNDKGHECFRTFQRMMGLKVDGRFGPITRAATIKRLLDRDIL
jgi:N-acetyl-anhydromuramyl-L-alanine amidase AmpD